MRLPDKVVNLVRGFAGSNPALIKARSQKRLSGPSLLRASFTPHLGGA
jgi:hypothetical protein